MEEHWFHLNSDPSLSFFTSVASLSIFPSHCYSHIHLLLCSDHPSMHSFTFPPLPAPVIMTPTPAHGCQSFRDSVSCEIAQIAVALRLAQQQSGEKDRIRVQKRERGTDFMLQHFWTWISPPPASSSYSVRHGQAQLQLCPLRAKHLPPAQPSSPPRPSPPSW